MMQSSLSTSLFEHIKQDFPIFNNQSDKPLVYLDSAASAQKPQAVIDALAYFYANDYANIHRGIYSLSARSSYLYEKARQAVADFIHANHAHEIVFLRGTTEAINLIAQTISRMQWQAGDEVILSVMEHHANIVPWYLLKEQMGIELKIIPIDETGKLNLTAYQALFTPRTKLVAVTHASNVMGTINPINEITAMAHAYNVPVLVDGAQAVPHMPVDVQALDCDFYTFSAHKLYGPTGTGVLFAKKKYLDELPPYQGGGGMIETVSFEKITFAKAPQKFEAGTPDIAGVMGLHAAINYVNAIGMQNIFSHEQQLIQYAEEKLKSISGLRMIGMAKPKVGVISFVHDAIHAHDLGTILDHEGIAVRAGHHCCMPLMQYFQVPATVRVSFGVYNTEQDVDALVAAIQLAKRLFQ
jgi:cysteine desulfurase / selenocysteine lyase